MANGNRFSFMVMNVTIVTSSCCISMKKYLNYYVRGIPSLASISIGQFAYVWSFCTMGFIGYGDAYTRFDVCLI